MAANIPMVMTTPAANNSSVDLGKNVEAASTRASWIFRAYMLTLFVGAVFSYWVWKSGNDAQAAVQAEAALRISDADAAGKQASKDAGIANKAAADANERATKLENANLVLKSQIAGLENDNLGLKKDVALANEAAALAQKEAADAKLALQEYRTPRVINLDEKARKEAVAKLAPFAGTVFDCAMPISDVECAILADSLQAILADARWQQIDWINDPPRGMILRQRGRPIAGAFALANLTICADFSKHPELRKAANAFAEVIGSAGISVGIPEHSEIQSSNKDAMHLLVGRRW